jgi:hypothetical protein
MPDGWQPNASAFLDGLQFGVFTAFAVIAVLLVVATVRRAIGAV